MAGDTIPTPDQVEQSLFIVKWWKEFLLSLTAALSIFAGVKRVQKVAPIEEKDQKVAPIGEKELDNRMQLCKHELKDELHDDIREIMREHKAEMSKEFKDLIEKIELMIEVAIK